MFRRNVSRPFVSASQVLRRLAELELEGVQFYQGMAEGAESAWVRKFAAKMGEAEQRHHERFIHYAEHAAKRSAPEDDQLLGELSAEINRLLSISVFAEKERARQSAHYLSDSDALRTAIRAEEHLAVLLTQLQDYVPKASRSYILRVIKEEWNHKRKLEEVLLKHL